MKQLRFGIVGGGDGSFIGNAHLQGARMDHLAVLTAACFSRDAEKNHAAARQWQVDHTRVYENYEVMAQKEAAREDGIDFVIIATPNNTHFDIAGCFLSHGIHVSCDKPVALDLAQALALQKLAQLKRLHFGVTYTYVNYPMVHQMRKMIADGKIGRILTVMAEYPQDWVLAAVDKNPDALSSAWRFRPEIAGDSACTADIGTHAEALVHFATGLPITSVLANLTSIPAYAPLETNTQVLFKLAEDIPGILWASQIAAGQECSVGIRVYGDKGALLWSHDCPNELHFHPINAPEVRLTCAHDFLNADVRQMSRIAYGHPEGFFEAFANYYRAFCTHILHLQGASAQALYPHPTIADGIRGMRFVKACLDSNAAGNRWVAVEP